MKTLLLLLFVINVIHGSEIDDYLAIKQRGYECFEEDMNYSTYNLFLLAITPDCKMLSENNRVQNFDLIANFTDHSEDLPELQKNGKCMNTHLFLLNVFQLELGHNAAHLTFVLFRGNHLLVRLLLDAEVPNSALSGGSSFDLGSSYNYFASDRIPQGTRVNKIFVIGNALFAMLIDERTDEYMLAEFKLFWVPEIDTPSRLRIKIVRTYRIPKHVVTRHQYDFHRHIALNSAKKISLVFRLRRYKHNHCERLLIAMDDIAEGRFAVETSATGECNCSDIYLFDRLTLYRDDWNEIDNGRDFFEAYALNGTVPIMINSHGFHRRAAYPFASRTMQRFAIKSTTVFIAHVLPSFIAFLVGGAGFTFVVDHFLFRASFTKRLFRSIRILFKDSSEDDRIEQQPQPGDDEENFFHT